MFAWAWDVHACDPGLSISGSTDMILQQENLDTTDPLGNDYVCRTCHRELVNGYLQCNYCRQCNLDAMVCCQCYHELKTNGCHPMDDMDYHWMTSITCEPCDLCHPEMKCPACHLCKLCSCQCHNNMTFRYRLFSEEDLQRLRARVLLGISIVEKPPDDDAFRCFPFSMPVRIMNEQGNGNCCIVNAVNAAIACLFYAPGFYNSLQWMKKISLLPSKEECLQVSGERGVGPGQLLSQLLDRFESTSANKELFFSSKLWPSLFDMNDDCAIVVHIIQKIIHSMHAVESEAKFQGDSSPTLAMTLFGGPNSMARGWVLSVHLQENEATLTSLLHQQLEKGGLGREDAVGRGERDVATKATFWPICLLIGVSRQKDANGQELEISLKYEMTMMVQEKEYRLFAISIRNETQTEGCLSYVMLSGKVYGNKAGETVSSVSGETFLEQGTDCEFLFYCRVT